MERKQVEDDHDHDHQEEEEEEVGFRSFVKEDRTTTSSLLQDEDGRTSSYALGEVSATDENGDGFKTPPPAPCSGTPVARECPPAPRKRRPVRWCCACRKRKASSGDHDHRSGGDDGARRDSRQQLDLSLEVEALFPPALLADFRRKIKKARRENFP